MLLWENSEQFKLEDNKELMKKIEKIGKEVIEAYNTPKVLHDAEGGRYWYKHFKKWEYPLAYAWINGLKKETGRKCLKIMDFGCWLSPFPEFLCREGHKVWGVDNDDWGYIKNIDVSKHYPHVNYFIDDIEKLQERDFDAIISCSVLEHIPSTSCMDILRKMRGMLKTDGKMMHIVDFYFPEKPRKEGKRKNFYAIAQALGFSIGDLKYCPNSPEFDLETVKKSMNFGYPQWNESRIAIGDDVEI